MLNILAYNFRSVLRSEIGLIFCDVLGSFPGLGKATTKALNILLGKDEEEASSVRSQILGASKDLNCL